MRVLICSLNYAPELIGIGKYNTELAEWFASRGHDVKVVCAPPYYPHWCVQPGHRRWWWSRETVNGVRIRRCPLWVPARPTGLRRIVHLVSFGLSSLPALLKQIFWRPDLVLMTEPPLVCAPAALAVSWLTGARAWLHVQDLEIDAGFGLGLARRPMLRRTIVGAERWLMRGFDAVTTISQTMLSRLGARVSDACRTELLPNWVDTAAFEDGDRRLFREQLGLGDDAILCVYSGNMGAKQGLDVVADAIRRLRDDARLHFLLCGNGPALGGLRERLADLPRVRFVDLQPADRLPSLLAAADIHLLPQRADFDGVVMPSKLLAMLASGRPIVGTCPADSELGQLLDGVGLVTPPGDAVLFADAIAVLADDALRRVSLGIAGRRLARSRFDGPVLLERIEAWASALVDPSASPEIGEPAVEPQRAGRADAVAHGLRH